MRQLLLLLFCLTGFAYGQTLMKGYVYDKKSHAPISEVSVYVNGSNKATRTDAKGFFELAGVAPSSLVVFSHMGYNLKTLSIESVSPEPLSVMLTEKEHELTACTVTGHSMRQECLQQFRALFLGVDNWGRNAKILNDSVLFFTRTTERVSVTKDPANPKKFIIQPAPEADSLLQENAFAADTTEDMQSNASKSIAAADPQFKLKKTFTVKAKAPLIVDLPLLGYTMTVDLVGFSYCKVTDVNAITNTLGFFHFTPHEQKKKRVMAAIEKKRREAYYNSALHFNRSLFKNQLKENGYMVLKETKDDSTHVKTYSYVNLNASMDFSSPTQALISGLQDESYLVVYVKNSTGIPVNLNNPEKAFGSANEFAVRFINEMQNNASHIIFLDDQCHINSDGTSPDNSIAFGGIIGWKKAGAMLPSDYEPE